MQHTRRSFLKSASLAATALGFSRWLGAAGSDAIAATPPGPVRGLLFDARDLPRMRANAVHPRFAAFWRTFSSNDRAADFDFLEHHVHFNRHADDMGRVRQIFERAAFVYAVNQDAQQLALARRALRRLLDFPQWDMFLEGGRSVVGLLRAPEACIALSFGIDWLGDSLSADEVAEIERAIAEKGAPACATTLQGMQHPDQVEGWTFDPKEEQAFREISLKRWPVILNTTNLKTVPAAGLGIAACRLHGRFPQAAEWLELARSSMREFAKVYGSDGCYGEGVSYWVPTTLDMAVFAEVLWRTQGIDDRRLINYPGTIRYAATMTLPRTEPAVAAPPSAKNMGEALPLIPPRYDIVNFGDANGGVEISLATWVGRNFNDPVSQFVAHDLGEVRYHYGLIWYDADAPASQPEPALLDHRLENDLVVSRTGWAAADSVVALRSGGPANHEHADRNSVIFKAHGDRLLHDPFRAGYSTTLERWKLRLTDAHTAILINGQGHQYHDGHEGTNESQAHARVTAFKTGPGWMTVTSDATDAYRRVNASVKRVERTLVFLKPDVLVFFDRVELDATPTTVQARFQVFNEDDRGSCAVDRTTFHIERPFATLHARVAGSGEFAIAPGRVAIAEKEGIFPFAEISTGPALHHAILTVCTAAPAGGAHGTITLSQQQGVWQVRGSHGAQTIGVNLAARGEGPPEVTL
jgi:hypothetical protein